MPLFYIWRTYPCVLLYDRRMANRFHRRFLRLFSSISPPAHSGSCLHPPATIVRGALACDPTELPTRAPFQTSRIQQHDLSLVRPYAFGIYTKILPSMYFIHMEHSMPNRLDCDPGIVFFFLMSKCLKCFICLKTKFFIQKRSILLW